VLLLSRIFFWIALTGVILGLLYLRKASGWVMEWLRSSEMFCTKRNVRSDLVQRVEFLVAPPL
jgi:hypothetical protein